MQKAFIIFSLIFVFFSCILFGTKTANAVTLNGGLDPATFTSTTTASYSWTIADHANRFLVVGVWENTVSNNVSSVTFNNIALTKLSSVSVDFVNGARMYVYYLINPPVGTYDVVATTLISGSIRLSISDYYDVMQTPPEVFATSTPTIVSTSSSRTLETRSNDALVLSVSAVNSMTLSAGPDTIQVGNRLQFSTYKASLPTPTPSLTTLNYVITGGECINVHILFSLATFTQSSPYWTSTVIGSTTSYFIADKGFDLINAFWQFILFSICAIMFFIVFFIIFAVFALS